MRTLIAAVAVVFFYLTSFAAEPDVPPRCPLCSRSDSLRPIIYGYPGEQTSQRAERGEIILGGCVISDDSPRWVCLFCDRNIKPLLEYIEEECFRLMEQWKLDAWTSDFELTDGKGIRRIEQARKRAEASWENIGLIYKPERIEVYDSVVYTGKQAFRFFIDQEGIVNDSGSDDMFHEMPLAAMGNVFSDNDAKAIASLSPRLSLYFAAPDCAQYRALAREIRFMLFPPQECGNLKFRLLQIQNLNTGLAEYEQLKLKLVDLAANGAASGQETMRKYLEQAIAIYENQVFKAFSVVISDTICIYNDQYLSCVSRCEPGLDFLCGWEYKDIDLKLVVAKTGMYKLVPFHCEFKFDGVYSLHAFFHSADNMQKSASLWEEIVRNVAVMAGRR